MHQLVLITALSATTGLFGGKQCGKKHNAKPATASCYSAAPCGATYAAPQAAQPAMPYTTPASPQAYPAAPVPAAPAVPPAPPVPSSAFVPTGSPRLYQANYGPVSCAAGGLGCGVR